MKHFKKSLSLFFGICLCLPWGAWPQEFSPIYDNLNRLGDIMTGLQNSNEAMTRDNGSLKSGLENLSALLKEQGKLLNEQDEASREMQKISEKQAALLGSYISRSRNLKISLLVAVPLAAGAGVLAGVLINR
jgi:hypothetical protein